MAFIPVECPDCGMAVEPIKNQYRMIDGELVVGICVGCYRHFHGSPHDWIQSQWELPCQVCLPSKDAYPGPVQEVADSSDPELRETL